MGILGVGPYQLDVGTLWSEAATSEEDSRRDESNRYRREADRHRSEAMLYLQAAAVVQGIEVERKLDALTGQVRMLASAITRLVEAGRPRVDPPLFPMSEEMLADRPPLPPPLDPPTGDPAMQPGAPHSPGSCRPAGYTFDEATSRIVIHCAACDVTAELTEQENVEAHDPAALIASKLASAHDDEEDDAA